LTRIGAFYRSPPPAPINAPTLPAGNPTAVGQVRSPAISSVDDIQAALNHLGQHPLLVVDGDCGPATVAASKPSRLFCRWLGWRRDLRRDRSGAYDVGDAGRLNRSDRQPKTHARGSQPPPPACASS